MKEITEEARRSWEALSRASLAISFHLPHSLEGVADAISGAEGEIMKEFGYTDRDEFIEAVYDSELKAVRASLENSTLSLRPCPANNPDCDVQLYSAGDYVFCPKCKQPNPDFHRTSTVEHRAREQTGIIAGKQPVVDVKAGVIRWKRKE